MFEMKWTISKVHVCLRDKVSRFVIGSQFPCHSLSIYEVGHNVNKNKIVNRNDFLAFNEETRRAKSIFHIK